MKSRRSARQSPNILIKYIRPAALQVPSLRNSGLKEHPHYLESANIASPFGKLPRCCFPLPHSTISPRASILRNATQTRVAVLKRIRPPVEALLTWLDRMSIRLCQKFADFKKTGLTSC